MVPAGFHGVERIAGHAWRYESRCLNRDNTDVISKKVEYFKALDLKNRRVDSIPIASISEALEIFLQLARIYPVHPRSRKSLGEIIRKLSVTESHISAHRLGTSSRRKTRVASANSPRVW